MVKKYPKFGLIIMGSDRDSDDVKALVKELGIEDNILYAGDQDHDSFLTIMTRSKLYLRTPVKDGVCSSVLEALALKVPVVGSENGSRPSGVVNYKNRDHDDLCDKLDYVLRNRDKVVKNIVKPDIKDTIKDEIAVIKNQ